MTFPDVETANMLSERFGWHPLDVEDVLSRRQRPKVDDYAEEGYLFGVLHFLVYDKNVQRLNAAELDVFIGPDYIVTLPTVELRPVSFLFRRAHENEDFRKRYDEVIRPLPYPLKLLAMQVPLDLPVTRIMGSAQKHRYLDEIFRQFSEQGLALTIPEDKRYGNTA